MKLNKELLEINKENIFKYTSNIEVFSYYMDKPVFDKAFSSPFRSDNNPSFIIRKKGYFKDYATGEYGDCFEFVKKLYKVNFNDALIQVINDLGIKEYFNIPISNTIKKQNKLIKVSNVIKGKSYKGTFELRTKQRKWEKRDLAYWRSYGISGGYLNWANIHPISHYFINNIPYVADLYAYVYIEKKDNVYSYKVYQPFSKHKKWINANDYSVWELWKGIGINMNNDLIITSSRKDALTLIENVKINSTAFQAETILPKINVMRDLFEVYKRHNKDIFLLFDNDFEKETNWGQKAANKLIERYPNLINIKIPNKYRAKDPSDLMFKHGLDTGIKVIRALMEETRK